MIRQLFLGHNLMINLPLVADCPTASTSETRRCFRELNWTKSAICMDFSQVYFSCPFIFREFKGSHQCPKRRDGPNMMQGFARQSRGSARKINLIFTDMIYSKAGPTWTHCESVGNKELNIPVLADSNLQNWKRSLVMNWSWKMTIFRLWSTLTSLWKRGDG